MRKLIISLLPKNARKTGAGLSGHRKGCGAFLFSWWLASAPFGLLKNARKTGAGLSGHRKGCGAFLFSWWLASAPFGLLKNARKTGAGLSGHRKGCGAFLLSWWLASAPFGLLKNARKTGAGLSGHRKGCGAFLLSWWLASAPFALYAAVAVGGSPKNNPAPPFHVAVLEGDGALNSLPSRAALEPVIRVADAEGNPLAGARVEFDVPKAGPGVTFGSSATHFNTTTNNEGVAKASGLRNNGIAGGFALLVHVSYQGQTLADMTLHQTNIAGNSSSSPKSSAHVAAKPRTKQQEAYPDASMSSTVLGVAMGDEFVINGTPTPTNANLAPGSRIQTKDSSVTVFIHEHCEFLVGPHSSVIIQPHILNVMGGAVRAKHFGDCKFGYGGLWVTSPSPNGDAVVALSTDHMEVGSVSGPVEVSNAVTLVNSIQPGAVSAFNFADSSSASGASISSGTSNKVAFMLGAGTAASLIGLGLAIDTIAQPGPASSTSP